MEPETYMLPLAWTTEEHATQMLGIPPPSAGCGYTVQTRTRLACCMTHVGQSL